MDGDISLDFRVHIEVTRYQHGDIKMRISKKI